MQISGGTVHCLSHPNERLPASTVNEPSFLLIGLIIAENTETVYVCIFQSDPRVVFSVADVSLSSVTSRSTVLS